jgi:Spy/CpxP family protein refolding chaperone
MANDTILSLIEAEIARLTQVRELLANTAKVSVGKVAAKIIARNAKKEAAPSKPAKTKVKKSRVLSPEARKRISEAQRKRWAAKKEEA